MCMTTYHRSRVVVFSVRPRCTVLSSTIALKSKLLGSYPPDPSVHSLPQIPMHALPGPPGASLRFHLSTSNHVKLYVTLHTQDKGALVCSLCAAFGSSLWIKVS
jgi:hypothetical protein